MKSKAWASTVNCSNEWTAISDSNMHAYTRIDGKHNISRACTQELEDLKGYDGHFLSLLDRTATHQTRHFSTKKLQLVSQIHGC